LKKIIIVALLLWTLLSRGEKSKTAKLESLWLALLLAKTKPHLSFGQKLEEKTGCSDYLDFRCGVFGRPDSGI